MKISIISHPSDRRPIAQETFGSPRDLAAAISSAPLQGGRLFFAVTVPPHENPFIVLGPGGDGIFAGCRRGLCSIETAQQIWQLCKTQVRRESTLDAFLDGAAQDIARAALHPEPRVVAGTDIRSAQMETPPN